MSIVKMKKLQLFAARSCKDELISDLLRLGCVQIDDAGEILEEPDLEKVVKRESSDLISLRIRQLNLQRGLEIMNTYAPAKSKLLAPLPDVKESVFLDDSQIADSVSVAERLESLNDRIKSVNAEAARQNSLIESLLPWQQLGMPLDKRSTDTCDITLGTIPAAVSLPEAEDILTNAVPESELIPVNEDKEVHYVLLLCWKANSRDAADALAPYGFSVSPVSGSEGTAAEGIKKAQAQLAALADEKKALEDEIVSLAEKRDELKLSIDRVTTQIACAEATERIVHTESVITFSGWIPAAEEKNLRPVLEKYDCAWELSDPEPDDIPDTPVKLKNNAVTSPLMMVTDMYSLPSYDNVDPNPLMAPFFILFYGIMMADMGYGILMALIGAIIMKKKRPRGGMRNFAGLMILCGISTFVWGALTGSFFGDAPLQIARMLNPNTTFTGLPGLFNPLNDTLMVLVGGMALGVVHIITGMVIDFAIKTRDGHFWDALMDDGSWWLLFIGIALGALGITWWVAIAGVVALICTQGRSKPTFIGKIIGGVASLYDITSFFGDILSYSRLMALMLAGSVIAQVFNTLGAITGNIVTFAIIFLIGHALNIGLNLLGCYVHDLRLQCLEYFGKFYNDGGKPFTPLGINTKYVNVVK